MQVNAFDEHQPQINFCALKLNDNETIKCKEYMKAGSNQLSSLVYVHFLDRLKE